MNTQLLNLIFKVLAGLNSYWNSVASSKKPWHLRDVFVPMSALSLVTFCVIPFPIIHAQVTVTVTAKDASDFWKDFDGHTQSGRGKHINDIYGGDPSKLVKDFNLVMKALNGCLDMEIKESHGRTPTNEDKKTQADRVKDSSSSGALKRLSKLQLDIMKDHFPDSAGNIDFTKLQLAFEMFANGELRSTGNEMDQMNQWFVWKCFANIAIDNNIDRSSWEKIIQSLEKGKEIYRRVYPPKPGAKDDGGRGELANPRGTESKHDRFDKTKQLTEGEKKKLRDEIDKLSVKQVLEREKDELTAMTTMAAAPCPRRVEFAQLRSLPQGEWVLLQISVMVADGRGRPMDNTRVSLLTSESGFAVTRGSFTDTRYMDSNGAGIFITQLRVPATVLSLSINASENGCFAFATESIAIASRKETIASNLVKEAPANQRLPEGAIFASASVESDTIIEVQQPGYALIATADVVTAKQVNPGDHLDSNTTSSIHFDDGTGMVIDVLKKTAIPIAATVGVISLLTRDRPQPLPLHNGSVTTYISSDHPFTTPAIAIDNVNKMPDKTYAVFLNRKGEKVGQLSAFTGLKPQANSDIVIRTLDDKGATLQEGKVVGGPLDGTPKASFDKSTYRAGEKGQLQIVNQKNYQKIVEMTRFGGAAKLPNESIRIIQLSAVKGLPTQVPFGTASLNFQTIHPGEARVAVIMPRVVPPKPVANPGNDEALKQSNQAFETWLRSFPK